VEVYGGSNLVELLKFFATPTTWLGSCECTGRNSYEGLVPRCDERLRDPSCRIVVGHVEERKHLGWGEWVQYLAFALLVVV
jgi:hypothetical protein